ncbi:MAG: hypothetical protein JXD23_17315 [Spirochaetales bacterium]|nr:hypothetical protein [Spirochaetales bacterium]
MRRCRGVFQAGVFGLLSLFLLGLTGCDRPFDMDTVESIAKMEHPMYKDKPVPKEIIAELVPLVKEYRQRVTEYADAAEQLQLLYKNVAQRYLDIGYFKQQIEYYSALMAEKKLPPDEAGKNGYYDYASIMLMQKRLYGEAFDSLQKSLALSPDNTLLLYYAGYCAALRGKAVRPENEEEGMAWLQKAIRYYDMALAIDPDSVDTLYGKSILLVYEFVRPAEAIPLLLHIKRKNTRNIDAMFVLASAYVMLGDQQSYQSALAEYEAIERLTDIEAKKKAARENIAELNALIRSGGPSKQ